jgi:mycofactocin precursor
MAETTIVEASNEQVETEVAPVLEDVLVEEVSIDGMCGVY